MAIIIYLCLLFCFFYLVSSPPSILYTLLDGTLGINDFDEQYLDLSFNNNDDDNDDYHEMEIYEQQQQQPQIVISPGSIVHLDCVFQETFGQPQWSVSDIPISNNIYYDSEHGTINNKIDSSSSSSFDQQHYHQLHHTQILNEQHWNPNQEQHQTQHQQQQKQQRKYQYSLSRNKHLRRNKYQNRRKHYYQQKKPGSSANIRYVLCLFYMHLINIKFFLSAVVKVLFILHHGDQILFLL